MSVWTNQLRIYFFACVHAYVCMNQSIACICLYEPINCMHMSVWTNQLRIYFFACVHAYVCMNQSIACICLYEPINCMHMSVWTNQLRIYLNTFHVQAEETHWFTNDNANDLLYVKCLCVVQLSQPNSRVLLYVKCLCVVLPVCVLNPASQPSSRYLLYVKCLCVLSSYLSPIVEFCYMLNVCVCCPSCLCVEPGISTQ